jgi:hypothetical protein
MTTTRADPLVPLPLVLLGIAGIVALLLLLLLAV